MGGLRRYISVKMFASSRASCFVVALFFLFIVQAPGTDGCSMKCDPCEVAVYPDIHVQTCTPPCHMTTQAFTVPQEGCTGCESLCECPPLAAAHETTQTIPPIYVTKTEQSTDNLPSSCCCSSSAPVAAPTVVHTTCCCRQQQSYTPQCQTSCTPCNTQQNYHPSCQPACQRAGSQPTCQQSCGQTTCQQPCYQSTCQQTCGQSPCQQPCYQPSCQQPFNQPSCQQPCCQPNWQTPCSCHQQNYNYQGGQCQNWPSACCCYPTHHYPFPQVKPPVPSFCVQSVVVGGKSQDKKNQTKVDSSSASPTNEGVGARIDPIPMLSPTGGETNPIGSTLGEVISGESLGRRRSMRLLNGNNLARNETENEETARYERYLDKLLDLLKDKTSSSDCIGPSPMVVVPQTCSHTTTRQCRRRRNRFRSEVEDEEDDEADDEDDDEDEEEDDRKPRRSPTIIVRSSAHRRCCNAPRPNCCCHRPQPAQCCSRTCCCRGYPRC